MRATATAPTRPISPSSGDSASFRQNCTEMCIVVIVFCSTQSAGGTISTPRRNTSCGWKASSPTREWPHSSPKNERVQLDRSTQDDNLRGDGPSRRDRVLPCRPGRTRQPRARRGQLLVLPPQEGTRGATLPARRRWPDRRPAESVRHVRCTYAP